MTLEHGVWVVLMVALFSMLWGSFVIWRAIGLKLVFDALSVLFLVFGKSGSTHGLNAMSLLLVGTGMTFVFMFVVFGVQFFKARLHD